MTSNSKIKKSISALLVIAILLPAISFSRPRQANAQFVPVNDILGNKLKTAILKATGGSLIIDNKSWIQKLGEAVLKMIAKRILAAMTQATVNWINNGFHGSPLFLENPESFFKDIAKSVTKTLVDMIGYDDFRFPFGKQTALNVIASYKSQFETNAQYSLYKVLNNQDLIKFRTNFNYGGWNGFLINTQYPQNNYLGFQNLVGESLGSQLAGTLQAPAEKVRETLQQGLGFLSPQTCADNGGVNEYNKKISNQFVRPTFTPTKYKPPDQGATESNTAYETKLKDYDIQYDENRQQDKQDWTQKNTCKNLVSTTPGYVAATQIANALDSPRMMTVLDGALGNSFAAIFDALLNKLISTGLNALASTVNKGPEDDGWRFEGQDLGGSNVGYSPPGGALNINSPEHTVSVNAGFDTVRNVAGGTGNYTIQTQPNGAVADVTLTPAGALKVIGKSISGETSVVIEDSPTDTTKTKRTTINIEVNDPSSPVTSPRSFLGTAAIGVNTIATARILGGVKPYSKLESSQADQAIAISNVYGDTLIISGNALGKITVTIKDASNKIFPVEIEVTDSVSPIVLLQESILVIVGSTKAITAPFDFGNSGITTTKSGIVSITSNGKVLNVKGDKEGETTIEVRSLNNTSQTAQYSIRVVSALKVTALQPYGRDGFSVGVMSGGTYPYRIVSCPIQVICGFNSYTYIDGNRLFVYPSGNKGTTPIIIGDAGSQQTVEVPFPIN